MYHTAVSQSKQLEIVPVCSKASKQVSLQESCLSGSQTSGKPRLITLRFIPSPEPVCYPLSSGTYEEMLLCYFLYLVISSSLPSRTDVSCSCNLIGMHGTYNR